MGLAIDDQKIGLGKVGLQCGGETSSKEIANHRGGDIILLGGKDGSEMGCLSITFGFHANIVTV
jgi:hypothetical protein